MKLEARIDIHIHKDEEGVGPALDDLATEIQLMLDSLEGRLMAKADELRTSLDALTKAFSDATDEIAKDLEELRSTIASQLASGLSAEQASALQLDIDTRLGAAAARLVELGKDPANPIPPEP